MSVEEIFQTMSELVAEQFAMEPAEVTMDTSFEEDLGADSVDLVDLVMAMEEEFEVGEIQEEDLKTLKTVGDAVNYIASKVKS
ncbi:acyl carrier protein [Dysosmobacter sp. NSJ-60]|uniref:Acyl carrier protein n=1 Tax=Pusillibacter faecalis TaxID=2714358 RepID=A0A810QL56_9FIRM|nr:acyl carrier protein [Pusillibacter faecalis]MBC5748730.1 acyl carrier protein [Dysosmobacter hominis]MBS5659311.1 acyl carrier protein [Oscillibacter sp.]MCQ5026030.1 acyl carrier protein [Oscillibacter valericigenes]BCK85053.1 acyl carrier protein [Pusillibacter faecalis]